MIAIKVHIAEGVDELAVFQPANLRHHHGEEGVGGNVEGHAEEDVGAALVKLAGEFAVGNVELKEGVARAKGHLGEVAHIPGRYDEAAAVGVALDFFNYVPDLVVRGAICARPATPLVAVNGAEVAFGVCPFVPDFYAVLFEISNVGIALKKPEELVDDALKVQLLRSHHRKAFGEVKAHLVAEYGAGAGTGAVALLDAGI